MKKSSWINHALHEAFLNHHDSLKLHIITDCRLPLPGTKLFKIQIHKLPETIIMGRHYYYNYDHNK